LRRSRSFLALLLAANRHGCRILFPAALLATLAAGCSGGSAANVQGQAGPADQRPEKEAAMTNPPPSRSGASLARVDPNFIGYRHICIVLVARDFSASERSAMTAAVAAEEAAYGRFGIGLESIESPTKSRSGWGGLCFAAGAGRNAEATLVGVFWRSARGIEFDMHQGAHSRSAREPNRRASAAERVASFLRIKRDFLEHPGRY
jgi:hypothetical protein